MTKYYYHTQEFRQEILKIPIICTRDDAWLGEAFYFWYDLEDAEDWGNTSKRKTGFYQIYKSEIEAENLLNTVFNEEHYNFWYKQIVKVAMVIIKNTGVKPTIKELNDYFRDKEIWTDVAGILFQDLPINPNKLLVKPIEYDYKTKTMVFPYRKRIQLAVYDVKIINNFALLKKSECV